MSTRPTPDKAPAFREAIAQWQLAARTAVKRSSSLPSSVFDACDPMLEARLAESVQELMERLQQPTGLPATESPDVRREVVEPAELARLQRVASLGDDDVEMHAGQMAESLGVLLDLVASFPAPGNSAALQLLREQFGISEQTDLDDAMKTLAALVTASTSDRSAAPIGADVEAMVAALCSQIAGAALVQSRSPAAAMDDGPAPEAPA